MSAKYAMKANMPASMVPNPALLVLLVNTAVKRQAARASHALPVLAVVQVPLAVANAKLVAMLALRVTPNVIPVQQVVTLMIKLVYAPYVRVVSMVSKVKLPPVLNVMWANTPLVVL